METIQHIFITMMIIAIVSECFVSAFHNLELFDIRDSSVNILMGIFTIGVSLIMKGVTFEVFRHLEPYTLQHLSFSWGSAAVLLLLSDLHYYGFHRLAHACRFVWASHVVHHSSEKYNLTVAIRLPFTNGFYRFLFWTPLCLVGFPPAMVMLMDTIVVFYTFFIHTETIGRLGWMEHVFNTPSHHRVHHSSNPDYLDKNFGGMLIIWDKLFGTFIPETEKPRYGTTKPLNSFNPVKVVCDEYLNILYDLKKSHSVSSMLKIVFGKPGTTNAISNSVLKPDDGHYQINTRVLDSARNNRKGTIEKWQLNSIRKPDRRGYEKKVQEEQLC